MMARFFLLLVVAVTAGLSPAAAAEQPSVLVKTAVMQHRKIASSIVAYGTVETAPDKTVTITALRPARIADLKVRAGDRVTKGQVLAVLATDYQAAAANRQAETTLTLARRELARTKDMLALHMATQSQLDAAKKALEDAAAVMKAQKQTGADQSQGAITAPFAGLIVSVTGGVGDLLQPGTAIFHLADTQILDVVLGIEVSDRATVSPGMAVDVTSVNNPQKPDRAIVTRVQDQINPLTRLVDVVARLAIAKNGALLTGARVKAVIHNKAIVAWCVPRQAVLSDDRGAYIFQADGARAQRVAVRTGVESDGIVAIEGKFDPQNQVIVEGNYELSDGAAIRETKR